MRALLLTTALLTSPAFADRFEAVQRVTAVTVYATGASVTREAVVEAKAGLHDIVIPYLPQYLDPGTLRVSAEGAEVIGTTFMAERLPVVGDRSSPEIDAARAEIKRLEGEQRASDTAIAAIREKAEVARARIEFLNNLALGGTGGPEAYSRASDEIASLISEIGKAEAEARGAEVAQLDLYKAAEQARAALLVLLNEDLPVASLVVRINAPEDGQITLTIQNLTDSAIWAPVYDVRLTRSGAKGTIALDRNIIVAQQTGEDWNDVALTLSTADPSTGNAPGLPYSQGWNLVTEEEWDRRMNDPNDETYAGGISPVVVEETPFGYITDSLSLPTASRTSLTLAYSYPVRVSVRTGTDVVRLAMEGVELEPELSAVAYPQLREAGYLKASVLNTSDEPILPGAAAFYVDGVLMSEGNLPLIVQGDKADLFFGKIDGIRVEHESKSDQSADTGVVFTASSRTMSESATIRNLTGEAWPIEVLLGLDYSTHADLKLDRVIDPRVTEMDVDGDEGVARWSFTLEPGKEQVITIEQKLSWPDGYVLE